MGHAQHDPAEYVPKEQRSHWEARDPIALYEKFLIGEKLLDEKTKKDLERKIDTLLAKERDFAENSPMPPPDLAEKGVYCTGDDCHKIRPKWERPLPKSRRRNPVSAAVWTVEGFGSGKGSGGDQARFISATQPSQPPIGKPASGRRRSYRGKTRAEIARESRREKAAANGKNGGSAKSSKSALADRRLTGEAHETSAGPKG